MFIFDIILRCRILLNLDGVGYIWYITSSFDLLNIFQNGLFISKFKHINRIELSRKIGSYSFFLKLKIGSYSFGRKRKDTLQMRELVDNYGFRYYVFMFYFFT